MKLKSLFAAVPVAFLAVGCNNGNVTTEPTSQVTATESQWMAVQPQGKNRNLLLSDPDDTHDMHGRSLHEFTHMTHQGRGRLMLMEMMHGTIPDTYTWGKEPSLQLTDVDAKLGRTTPTSWKLSNLQLVGLVKQPDGLVYQIPNNVKARVNNVTEYPTRTLDVFEREALTHLQNGQYAMAYVEPNRVRMLGAVRSTTDCAKCHKVPDGTLLGAFTYDLVNEMKTFVPKPKPVVDETFVPVPKAVTPIQVAP